MEHTSLKIESTPALVWGGRAKGVYLSIHGQGGCKEEAEVLAEIACRRGWQVLSVDLPEHGGRTDGAAFAPWDAVRELTAVLEYAQREWETVALHAVSIGAWFSMLAFPTRALAKCLFVSPVLDMDRLIERMMGWAGVTEERLRREGEIPTDFGQTLSWEYREYVKAHLITNWSVPTQILYGAGDHLVERETVESFARRFGCGLTVMEDGEHWFHTPPELDFLRRWIERML
mgnify:FL=1